MSTDRSLVLAQALKQLRARWPWFFGVGIVLLLLGAIAMIYVVGATLASVVFIASLMILGGVAQLIHAWGIRPWANFLLWSITGALYVVAGVFALINPIEGAALLTLLLGGSLIAMGALRLWLWFQNRSQVGWQWLALSGLFSLVAGLLIAAGWPNNSLYILGMLLSIDLLFQGWALLWVGIALRRAYKMRP